MNIGTNLPEVPANQDNLIFPASTFNPLINPEANLVNVTLNSIQIDAGYTIEGNFLSLGAGGISVNAVGSKVQFFTQSTNDLILNAPTTPVDVTTGSDLEFGAGALIGNSDLAVFGGGYVNYLPLDTTNTGTLIVSNGQINIGSSGDLPPPKQPKVNSVQVASGGKLSIAGNVDFGNDTPVGNIEVDGGGVNQGQLNVYDGSTLNTTSLSGTGFVNPGFNYVSGTSTNGGVINVGAQVGATSSATPVINVNAGGTIAPGAPGMVGSLDIFGAPVNFRFGSTLAVGFGGTGSVVADELIDPTNTITLAGAKLAVTLPTPPPVGVPVTILEANAINGTFAGLNNDAIFNVGNVRFQINYLPSLFNATSVTLTRLADQKLPPASFDGDDLTDPAVYLTGAGAFAIGDSSGKTAGEIVPFGVAGVFQTTPAVADYYGTGQDDIAVYLTNYGAFAIQDPTGQTPGRYVPFGVAGDGQTIPTPGDYYGTGQADIAVYLPSYGAFAIQDPSGQTAGKFIPFGVAGSGQTIPAPADYYGTGRDDVAVYLAQYGAFAIQDPSGLTAGKFIPFGQAGLGNSIPVPGDYDGSGHVELAVYIPSLAAFFYRPYNGGPDVEVPIGVANSGELPVPGDYDGSGHDEVAIYDPAGGFFEYRSANSGSYVVEYFGANNHGSIPVAAPSGALLEFNEDAPSARPGAYRSPTSGSTAPDFTPTTLMASASTPQVASSRPAAIPSVTAPGAIRVARGLINQAVPDPVELDS